MNTTMKNYEAMTSAEINKELDRLAEKLEKCICIGDMGDAWDETYKEYSKVEELLNKRYREDNQERFDAYYEEHIKGKAWNEIEPERWEFYSDWHKEMYGYRPR